jgi:hypothetical protein
MAATVQDLTIEQGASFSLTVAVGVGYAGKQPRSRIRDRLPPGRAYGAYPTLSLVDFTCSVVDGSGNTVLTLSDVQTAALISPPNARFDEVAPFLGFWDLEVPTAAGGTDRLRRGKVYLSREATV